MTNEQRIRYVFDAICAYKLAHDGCSPTRDELVELTQTSKTSVHTIVRVLEARGLLCRATNRNSAGKIYVVGGVWLPPEGWQSPLDAEQKAEERRREEERKQAAEKAGELCECGEGVVKWQKRMTFPVEKVMLLCDTCREFEMEMYGKAGIEAITNQGGTTR